MPRSLLCIVVVLFTAPNVAHAEVFTSDFMEWRREDGGNGHRYAVFQIRDRRGSRRLMPIQITWPEARDLAITAGGHLATITSSEEQAFVNRVAFAYSDPNGVIPTWWIGGFQSPETDDPSANWNWVTGEPFVYTNWNLNQPFPQPDDRLGNNDQDIMALRRIGDSDTGWHDLESSSLWARAFIVEFPVPEPTGAGLILVAGLVGLMRKRR